MTHRAATNPMLDGFEAQRAAIYERVLRLTHCAATAEDVVQDTFLHWQAQVRKELPAHPRAWLLTVATRRVFELARKNQPSMLAANGSIAAPPNDSGLAQGDRAKLKEDVLTALGALTEMQREVLLAKVLDEQTFAEIATELNIAVPTAKTHYLRGLRHMRDRLNPRWSRFYEA